MCVCFVCALWGVGGGGEHNPGMIHPAIGIGQVATATLAPDPQDRLELAQNESKRARERQIGGEGRGGRRDGLGRLECCQRF